MQHAWGKRELGTKFWLESLKERDLSEDPGLGGSIILKWILAKSDLDMQIGFVCLRIGTGGVGL